MMAVTLLGPAGDMSVTSGGYYCRDEEGRFFRSTVVVIPKQQATTAQALDAELQQLQLQQDVRPEEEVRLDEGVAGEDYGMHRDTPEPWGAEDILEAYRQEGTAPRTRRERKKMRTETEAVQGDQQVSQSAHVEQLLEQISQSVHEHQEQQDSGHNPQAQLGGEDNKDMTDPTGCLLQQRREQDVLLVMDPPTRRIYGKASPGQVLPARVDQPFLRPVRKGGEYGSEEGSGEAEDAEGLLQEGEEELFALWQHKRVKHLIQEELAEMFQRMDGHSNGSKRQRKWRT